MHPVLDIFDWFEIPLYTAWVAAGAVVGLLAAYLFLRTRSRRASAPPVFLDGALLVLAAGWIGARFYHVAVSWDYYSARPDKIAQTDLGGLGIRGGFVLAFVVLLIYAAARRISFWHFADAAALGLALGQAVGWIGALVQGANYGVISDSQIAMDLPDVYGLIDARFPLQLAEIAFFFLLFLALVWLASRRPRPGALFVVYLLVASVGGLLLGFQRGDDTLYVGALRIDQVVDAGLAVLAVLLGLAVRLRRRGGDSRDSQFVIEAHGTTP